MCPSKTSSQWQLQVFSTFMIYFRYWTHSTQTLHQHWVFLFSTDDHSLIRHLWLWIISMHCLISLASLVSSDTGVSTHTSVTVSQWSCQWRWEMEDCQDQTDSSVQCIMYTAHLGLVSGRKCHWYQQCIMSVMIAEQDTGVWWLMTLALSSPGAAAAAGWYVHGTMVLWYAWHHHAQ